MQKKCDLYLFEPVKSGCLRFIEMFDKDFRFDDQKSYVGFLHANVDRVKLVAVVSDLRSRGIDSVSVPVEYRDRESISQEHAFDLANAYARSISAIALDPRKSNSKSSPMYWTFDLNYDFSVDERANGAVMIDRLDGHIWTLGEYEEYMYDYNNVL